MKFVREFVTSTVVGGLFVVVPVYLAVLLLLKGMKSVAGLVRPFAALLPDSLPAEDFFALLAVLVLCFIVGMLVRTRAGRVARESLEKMFFERLPGYGLLRGLTQRLAGEDENTAWAPALIEIEDALVPGFIIEELGGRPVDRLRPVRPDTARRRCLHHRSCARPRAGHPVHRRHQVDLPVGGRVEGPRCGDATARRRVMISAPRGIASP